MIRSVNQTTRFAVAATAGDIGSVDAFYFDDEQWAIRYVVVDTGKWLPRRRVLISPISIARAEWGERRLVLSLTRDQVRNAPDIDSHKPVSRQHEAAYFNYYGYPYYWAGGGLWGGYATPMMPTAQELAQAERRAAEEQEMARRRGDAHLRSTEHVAGYSIAATDGHLGHVEDFLFEDTNWAIRYLVVDTKNWWFGKHVIVAPEWITEISWATRSVKVNVSRQTIKAAPEYDGRAQVERQWEETYYQHVRQPGYWTADDGERAIAKAQEALQRDEQPTGHPLERGVRPR
jgi:hypothetical protein